MVPPQYTADVSIVLATPVNGGTVSTDKTKQGMTNPFLSFNDALKIGASIVILSMNTQDVWTELGAPKDGPTEITIDDGRTNPNVLDISGPYIYIKVASDSPERASAVLMTARKRVSTELFKWQKALGAPPNTFITSTDIVPPSRPEVDRSAAWQSAIGGAVLFLAAGLAIAYGVLRRRALRSPSASASAPAPAPVSAPAPAEAVVAETPAVEPEPEPELPPVVSAAVPAARVGRPPEVVADEKPIPDDDSSSTMEFPAYRAEELSPVPGKARQDDGGE